MLTATWVLAGATTPLLALTSFVAVITWRENRRREREDQQTAKILEAARKEFSDKKEVGDLKSTLTGFAVLGGIVGAVIMWGKLDKG